MAFFIPLRISNMKEEFCHCLRNLELLCEHAYENHCFQQIRKCGREFHDKIQGRYKKVMLQKDCRNAHLSIA